MGYAQETGYIPTDVNTIMMSIMNNINTQFGTAYTEQTFVGTNFYKYFYALAQKVQEGEIKASEIFAKVQDYFKSTNEYISRPVVTPNGIIDALKAIGYSASVKPAIDADAGKVYIAVDVDSNAGDYATRKLAIATVIKNSTVLGAVTQGTETQAITLSNGQSFTYKYNLPNKITPKLKLTITLSANNQSVIKTVDEIKTLLLANINASYSFGKNFEPQKYFSMSDAPWASAVKLEYSLDNGVMWASTVYSVNYNDLFVCTLANITIVEN